MSTFKPYPELAVATVVQLDPESPAGGVVIVLKNGDEFASDSLDHVQRLVDCWNACRKLHSPAAHISATDEYVERLEKLRKDACARVAELEAELSTALQPEWAREVTPAATQPQAPAETAS